MWRAHRLLSGHGRLRRPGVKTATKITHSVWSAFWSVLLVGLFAGHLFEGFNTPPLALIIPLLALAWTTFSFALILDRGWGWYGSFCFSVLSLFLSFLAVLVMGGKSWMAFAAFLPGAVVIGFLLETRVKFIGEEKNASP
jgi:hypothetical protein